MPNQVEAQRVEPTEVLRRCVGRELAAGPCRRADARRCRHAFNGMDDTSDSLGCCEKASKDTAVSVPVTAAETSAVA